MSNNNFEIAKGSDPVNQDADKTVADGRSAAWSPQTGKQTDASSPPRVEVTDTATQSLPGFSLVPGDSPSADRPKIGMAWNNADNLKGESSVSDIALNNLVFTSPGSLGLRWDNQQYKGLSTGFTPESRAQAQQMRAELLEKNPQIKTLAEIRYRDAPSDYLPEGSNWWMRDSQGKIEKGFEGHGLHNQMLDFTNPQFQDQVAAQAKAAVQSGATDGIMLDWYNDGQQSGPKFDQARLQLLTKIRAAVGPDALILINSNATEMPDSVNRLVNGYFMECDQSTTAQDWTKIQKTLDYAEKQTQLPRINVVETWPDPGHDGTELNKMRATTTLAMTHAPDASAFFSNKYGVSSQHDWYSFYDAKVGKPAGPLTDFDGSSRREYENGTVIYNPEANKPVNITFPEARTSAATGKSGQSFVVNPEDGDIFLK